MKIIWEFWQFTVENKKWWLIPFFVVLGILSFILYLGSGTVVSPFVYTLF